MSTALAVIDARPAFGADQVELIKRTIAKGATDDELKLFMAQCERTGLDPFDRQIYFIKRKQWDSKTNDYIEVGQTQTSIDGFRVVAERTGEMDGQDVAWCAVDGVWRDVWLAKEPPAAARVIAYRKGCSHGFPAIARFDEYVQTKRDGKPTGMWAKMPSNQLAKCAEALALRKAFPKQLSGLYTREEMGQAESEAPSYRVEAPKEIPRAEPSTPKQIAGGPEGSVPHVVDAPGQSASRLNSDDVVVVDIKVTPTGNPNIQRAEIVLSNGETKETKNAQAIALAEQLCQEREPVEWAYGPRGGFLGVKRKVKSEPFPQPASEPLTANDIAF